MKFKAAVNYDSATVSTIKSGGKRYGRHGSRCEPNVPNPQKKKSGIVDLIRKAKTEDAVNKQLSRLAKFESASPVTVRRAKRVAFRRIGKLKKG